MEDKIQYDIIKLMESLKEHHSNNSLKDIVFLGSIDYQENIDGVSYDAKKDIFMIIEEKDGVTSFHYYDEKQKAIAIDFEDDGRDIMAIGDFFKERDVDFTKSILDDISNLDIENSISLNEIESNLEKYAKSLGVSKEQILSAATIDLNKVPEKKFKKDKIHLDNSEDKEISKEENKNALDHISTKSEVDLDEKVTGKQTLGQILGVPAGGKLIALYSEHIANNENTAEFSFLLQKTDGTLEPADMLDQVDGNQPDKKIASVNRDGSEIKNQQVNSLFSIDSTGDTHDMLSIRRGNMGILELSYVQMDPTDNTQGMSIPLETDNIQPITSQVRNEMNTTKGIYNVSENLDEYNVHQDIGCDNITLEEIDGDPNTGHQHLEENDSIIDSYINEIMENHIIDDNYYPKEVKETFLETAKKHPDLPLDEIKRLVEYDLEMSAPIQERY